MEAKKRYCKMCQTDISDRHRNAIYCLACRSKRETKLSVQRKKNKAVEALGNCVAEDMLNKKQKVSLEEVIQAADKAGMSYGKFVQLMEQGEEKI